jgi:hypothetical protein
LPNLSAHSDNQIVRKKLRTPKKKNVPPSANLNHAASDGFVPGSIILATLREPREKFWGALLHLDPAGLSIQGVELSSFEDATSAVIAGEPLNTAVLFFPMHRVERIAMDLPEGNLPSLSQRFASRTGLDAHQALADSAQAATAGSADR